MKNKFVQCTITLNRSCNLRCNFCYAKDTGYCNVELIPLDNLKKIINLCKEEGIKYIVFTGGEPTLYSHLFEAIEYVKTNGIIPTIATNGLLLTNIEFCKKLINSGIDYIDLSVKGFDKENYKNTTGVDGYEKCLTSISNLAKLNANFNCSMVLTKDNIDKFCLGVKKIFNMKAKSISFTFEIDNKNCSEHGIEYLEKLNPILIIEKFFKQINSLNKISKGEWWIEFGYPFCMYNKHQLELLKNKMAAPCQIRKRNGITFDGDMNLIPCNMFYTEKIGKFGKDFSSKSEFDEYINMGIYREATKKNRLLPSKKCKKCEYLNQCRGGCPIYWKHFSLDDLLLYTKNYYETAGRTGRF